EGASPANGAVTEAQRSAWAKEQAEKSEVIFARSLRCCYRACESTAIVRIENASSHKVILTCDSKKFLCVDGNLFLHTIVLLLGLARLLLIPHRIGFTATFARYDFVLTISLQPRPSLTNTAAFIP